jgi:diguanylate cyclase (GGDEF)-like protein/PAS domain S-box-containing protein
VTPPGTREVRSDDLREIVAERFRTAFEIATTGMAVWAPDGSFLRVNQAFCELVGRSEDDLAGLSVLDVVRPDDRLAVEPLTRGVIEGGGSTVMVDLCVARPDGTAVETQASISIARDDAERVLYLFAQLHDVSALRHAVMVLVASERRLRAMIDKANDAYIAIDLNGVVQDWNPAAERMFGWSRDEIIDRELAEHVIPPELRAQHREGLAHYRKTQTGRVVGQTLELTGLRRDGTTFPIELTIWASGTPAVPAFHALIHDVSVTARAQEQLLRHSQVFATIREAVVVTDADGVVLDVNPAAEAMFGRSRAELIGKRAGAFEDPVEAERRWQRVLTAVLAEGTWSGDIPYSAADGSRRVRGTTVVPIWAREGSFAGVIGVSADVTEQRQLAAELAQSEQRWRLTIEHSPIGIALSRMDGRWLRVNAAFCRIVGYTAQELLGGTFHELTHRGDADAEHDLRWQLLAGTLEQFTVEQRYRHARGHDVWVRRWVSLVRDEDGEPLHFISQIEDISERRAQTDRLAELATQDPLTGLANRTVFLERLEAAAASPADEPRPRFGVVYIDLDDFKRINDTLGHTAGDELLAACAHRLMSAVRPGDTPARLGGDEFALLLAPVAGRREAKQIARRILVDLTRPYRIGGATVRTSVSIGVALDAGGDSGDETLETADQAMYRAKQAGKARYVILP